MKDRTAELRRLQTGHDNQSSVDSNQDFSSVTIDFEKPTGGMGSFTIHQSNHHTPSALDPFFDEVHSVKEMIQKINIDIDEVNRIHSSILSSPTSSEDLKNQLEDLMTNIKKTATKVRTKLKVMEQDMDHLEKANSKIMTADYRIRKTQHTMLSHKFVDVMTSYNKIQTEYRERCKCRIQRQLEITGRSTTNDELEEMLESGNPAIFTQGIMTDTKQAKQTLADIEARHADIIKLECSIRELHDMFMDMAMLVESQGEMIDRIEYHVEKASEYVEAAKDDTKKAVVFKSRSRKKKILILACLIIGITIIIICSIKFS